MSDDDYPVSIPHIRGNIKRRRITLAAALTLFVLVTVGVALLVNHVVGAQQNSSSTFVPPSVVAGGSTVNGSESTSPTPVPDTTPSVSTDMAPNPVPTYTAPTKAPLPPTVVTPVAIPGGSPVSPVGSISPGGSPILFGVFHDIMVNDEVDQVIRSVALSGGSEFDDPNSYQSMALRWLHTDASDPTSTVTHQSRWSRERLIQRYALACIYYATNGVSHLYTDMEFGAGVVHAWFMDTDWLSTKSECEWFRVTCDTGSNDTTTAAVVVTELNLYENGLTGSFPGEVELLYDMIKIDLYDNWLWNVGDEGHAWMSNMTSLEYLYYSNNYFEYDGIPTQLSELVNLREYDCSYTLYAGPLLGESFADLTALEYVVLSGNAYNSSVPFELASLPNLERLYLEEASLRGSLDFVTSMTSIVELWMDFNFLEGTIPTEIGTLSTLASLSLSNNFLTGAIPKEMASMTQMAQLWLYNNTFSGRLPSEFGTLSAMKILYLDGSQISGHVPSQVCALRNTGSLETLVTDCAQDVLACACCTACA